MSDIKLFAISGKQVEQLTSQSVELEKSLQSLIENNMEVLLGVRFISSEYSTGKEHGGRIDSLGLDENNCPVIIEYKRSINENVINQGLFYMDWLLNHKKEFAWLVMESLDKKNADHIQWDGTRLLCIASDFTKYDEHAVKQINRNIELIRYRKYSDKYLLFDLVNATQSTDMPIRSNEGPQKYKTFVEIYKDSPKELIELYEEVKTYLLSIGDDVQEKQLQSYVAFKRLKNFACLELRPQKSTLLAYIKVDPNSVDLNSNRGLLRDVTNIGHFGTGDLEITIKDKKSFDRAKEYFLMSYDES